MRVFSRWATNTLLALAAVIVVFGVRATLAHSRDLLAVADFRVVYCGEQAVVRDRVDPYRVEPLRSCEHRVQGESGEPAWSVTPFPLPSYAAAALAPLAFLPYRPARAVWLVALALALGLAAAAVAEILDTSAFAVGLVFAPTVGLLNLHYGEPVLISIAALCLAAFAVARNRPTLAALAGAVSMIEPHVGLPAAVGLFVFVPQTRRTLAIAAVAFAAVGIAALGWQANVEYARGFLPAQARAELIAADQFSLSHLLFVLGVAPAAALAIGSASYVATLAIGLLVARALVRRGFVRALYVLVPVATAMLGGPFIHDVQVAAAVPAALVLAERRWTARIAVALLALDWTAPLLQRVVSEAAAAFGTATIVLRHGSPVRRATYALVATVALVAVAFFFPVRHGSHVAATTAGPPAFATGQLSSVPWGWRIATTPGWSDPSIGTVVAKLPIWIALLLTPLSLVPFGALGRRRRIGSSSAAA